MSTEDLYTPLPPQNQRRLAVAIGALTRRKGLLWFDLKARDDDANLGC